MARFEKYLTTDLKDELDKDDVFLFWKELLAEFGIDDKESLTNNFMFLYERVADYDYKQFCDDLWEYLHLIVTMMIEIKTGASDENLKNEIHEEQGEYEEMMIYVGDELLRFQTYRDNILSKRELVTNDEGNNLKTNSDKIRLLHSLGIIDFLWKKFPNTSDNKIAKFFELISEKPMIAKNTNSLFTTEKTNEKYLMKNLTPTQKQRIRTKLDEFGFSE